MHLLFVLFDFTIVFCFAWDDYVASFCNSPPQNKRQDTTVIVIPCLCAF